MTLRTKLPLIALLALAPATAMAAGGSTDTDTSMPSCETGQVFDEDKNECVDQQAGVISDEALTDNAFALARQGRFEEARAVLDLRLDAHDSMSMTALGFITRKEGDPRSSINYYMQAIAMDATNTQVRQYLGEAYVQLGWMDDAERQLDTIASLAGTESDDYQALAAFIAAAS